MQTLGPKDKHRKSFPILLLLSENHSTKSAGLISLTFISFIKKKIIQKRKQDSVTQIQSIRNWFWGKKKKHTDVYKWNSACRQLTHLADSTFYWCHSDLLFHFLAKCGCKRKGHCNSCVNALHLAVLNRRLKAVSAWKAVAHLSGSSSHGRGWMHIQQIVSYIQGKILFC